MNNEDRGRQQTAELFQKFETLLKGDSLSDDEKKHLSQEILKIIYQSGDEVNQ